MNNIHRFLVLTITFQDRYKLCKEPLIYWIKDVLQNWSVFRPMTHTLGHFDIGVAPPPPPPPGLNPRPWDSTRNHSNACHLKRPGHNQCLTNPQTSHPILTVSPSF